MTLEEFQDWYLSIPAGDMPILFEVIMSMPENPDDEPRRKAHDEFYRKKSEKK